MNDTSKLKGYDYVPLYLCMGETVFEVIEWIEAEDDKNVMLTSHVGYSISNSMIDIPEIYADKTECRIAIEYKMEQDVLKNQEARIFGKTNMY